MCPNSCRSNSTTICFSIASWENTILNCLKYKKKDIFGQNMFKHDNPSFSFILSTLCYELILRDTNRVAQQKLPFFQNNPVLGI